MSDEIKCQINRNNELVVYAKCSGYRQDEGEYKRMAITEVKYPDADLIASALYCTTENKNIADIDLIDLYNRNKIIELSGYYSLEPYLSQKKSKGLPPKILKSILPTLIESGYEVIILHAAGDDRLVSVYEKMGLYHMKRCPYPMIAFDVIDSIFELSPEEIFEVAKNPLKKTEVKHRILAKMQTVDYGQNIMIGSLKDMLKDIEMIEPKIDF